LFISALYFPKIVALMNPKSTTPLSFSDKLTYAQSGVDIDAGEALVEAIKPLAKSTRRKGAEADLGGFGALFDLKAAGFHDPLIVATTDGVGTKLKLVIDAQKHDQVGIDLVAMCVNDLLAQGAEPLVFLDYYATGALKIEAAKSVIAGIAEGCRQAGCALSGGETAEMPGLYNGDDYDLAGFAIGAVERGHVLPRLDTQKRGDLIIGLPSSGAHSNGFSLIRKVMGRAGLSVHDEAPFAPGLNLGDVLLTATKIYVSSVLPLLKQGIIKGAAHITGGGLIENPNRAIHPNLTARIDFDSLDLPPLFQWLQEAGSIETYEMHRTFNCGIGFVLYCAPKDAGSALANLLEQGIEARIIGELAQKDI
jgi:phosphoribosylformylglycinamidine cyclo-ligase